MRFPKKKQTVYILYVLLYMLFFIITTFYSSSNHTVLYNKGLYPVYKYVKVAAIAER